MSTRSPARVGDLFALEHEGGLLLTQVIQVDADGVVEFIGYGDVVKERPTYEYGYVVARELLTPAALSLVGKWFPDMAATREAMRPVAVARAKKMQNTIFKERNRALRAAV
jgi:hypothetical protein